jgi:predicted acetyltransferase
MAEITARPIEEQEYDEWVRVESAAFGGFPDPEHVELERKLMPLDRMVAAFDGERLIATAATYGFDMTVPGGQTVPVSGLTAVGALGTHRRRGGLRAMMEVQLDDSARRGEVATILNASESNIYGRFGYGLAQQYQRVRLRTERAVFDPPARRRSLRLVPQAEAVEPLQPIFDAYRLTRAGEVSRADHWWDGVVGNLETWKGGGKIFVVIAEPEDDDPGGYVIYSLQPRELSPFKKMIVRELIASSPETEATLWQYCVELDLVDEVEVESRPLDDPIRWRLTEPRRLDVVWQYDFVWVRLLDIAGGLAARAYGTEGEIVFELRDAFRPENDGTYRLAGSPKGGECARTSAPADIELTIADLGALYLGGVKASTLAQAGRVAEARPGALDLADDLFAWPLAPHCTTRF